MDKEINFHWGQVTLSSLTLSRGRPRIIFYRQNEKRFASARSLDIYFKETFAFIFIIAHRYTYITL